MQLKPAVLQIRSCKLSSLLNFLSRSESNLVSKGRKFESVINFNELFKITDYSSNREVLSIAAYVELQQQYLDLFAYPVDGLKKKPDSRIVHAVNFFLSYGEKLTKLSW